MRASATTDAELQALAAGFNDPVHDAQSCFRSVMNALARPGKWQTLATGGLAPPEPLTASVAAIALTLLDFDTPVWLDQALAQTPTVPAFLRFHTGAPIVTEVSKAAFALISTPTSMPALAEFAHGTAEYPDRSTTLILSGHADEGPPQVRLRGPGIETVQAFAASPLPPQFWQQMQVNHRQFPCGVDVIFADFARVAAIPRSTTITIGEG